LNELVWTAEPTGEQAHRLGEGPHWDAQHQRLSWVDIPTGLLWVRDAAGRRGVHLGQDLGVAVPHHLGGWVCGLGRGIALVAEDGSVEQHLDLEPAGVRMNDGKCDRLGRFFVGSKAHDNRAGAGRLWRLDLDGSVETVLDGLTIANGIGWSPDEATMYVTDSGSGRIDAHDYDPRSGALGARRTFVQLLPAEGTPDGLAVDAAGDVWTAVWGGGQVRRYSPEGQLTAVVRLGCSLVTSCAFTGADLTTLVITTAWDELTPEQRAEEPDAGRLHQVEVGVRGEPGQPCRAPLGSLRAAAT
jgi:sugar lactone lactonase YvrE